MNNPLEKIIIEPKERAEYAIIWLHGLGADGNDFAPLVPELNLTNVRFIFPHAPVRPVTLNMGMAMRAWYDIYSLDRDAKEDEQGIKQSQSAVYGLIQEQVDSGISTDKIFLVGFSQGGAMALYTGLRFDKPLAGIIALSAYLPLRETLANELNSQQQQTPIFMAHGQYDMVVPYIYGEKSKSFLVAQNYKIEWHAYPMDHSVCMEEVADVKRFLLGCMG